MRVLSVATCGAALFVARQEPAEEPAEAESDAVDFQINYEVCSSAVGSYEDHTTRMSVFAPNVYLATPHSLHHASGNITSSTECTCGGVLKFADGADYMWKYDLFTCQITWTKAPTHGTPHAVEANTWQKDGVCKSPPSCDPAAVHDMLVTLTIGEATAAAKCSSDVAAKVQPVVDEVTAAVDAFLEKFPTNHELTHSKRDMAKAAQAVSAATMLAAEATNTTAAPAPAEGAAPGAPQPTSETPVEEAQAAVPQAAVVPAPQDLATPAPQQVPVLMQQRLAGKRRVLLKKDPTEAKLASGCQALSGEFERETSIIEVHNGNAYAINGNGVHATGIISGETPCTCSGEFDYGEVGTFEFKYDLEKCTLTWSQPPTLEVPHSVEVNVWHKDGPCATARQCSQQLPAPRAVNNIQPADIGVKAEIAMVKLASALTMASVAANILAAQAVIEAGKHKAEAEAAKGFAEQAVAALEKALAPAQQDFTCLAAINPRAAQPARTAIQTITQMTKHSKKAVATFK
mmetsp:Transcript_41890/g.100662  ORF Transcript_41890/g.100662 Transcript_41890/m.100662 type:complete len:517 (+) Transcript_41890:52-1602(+)